MKTSITKLVLGGCLFAITVTATTPAANAQFGNPFKRIVKSDPLRDVRNNGGKISNYAKQRYYQRGQTSTSQLAVESYATLYNPNNENVYYRISGRSYKIAPKSRRSIQLGSNSGNYAPRTIQYNDRKNVWRSYRLQEGRYEFRWTGSVYTIVRTK